MVALLDLYEAFLRFMEAGGDVLWLILGTAIVLWTLLLERFWYVYLEFPRQERRALEQWREREDHASWYAKQVRKAYVSDLRRRLNRGMSMINTLIAICPLLGLLGTVTGMIQVFDVMAAIGTGNPRAMASGVSAATIPTMSGLVVALSGLFLERRLEHSIEVKVADANEAFATS